MDNKYESYESIKIEELTFLWINSRNKAVYNRLKHNSIDTLSDLFNKYDTNSIILPSTTRDANNQARGIIELIRFKYLKCDTLLDIYLNKIIKPFKIRDNYLSEVIYALRCLGFEEREAIYISHYMSRTIKEELPLGHYLRNLYNKDIIVPGLNNNMEEDYKVKLPIIVEYYNMKQSQELKEANEFENLRRLLVEESALIAQRKDIDQKLKAVRNELDTIRSSKKGRKL